MLHILYNIYWEKIFIRWNAITYGITYNIRIFLQEKTFFKRENIFFIIAKNHTKNQLFILFKGENAKC